MKMRKDHKKGNSTYVTDFSRHGDINEHISLHHRDPDKFRRYRRDWEEVSIKEEYLLSPRPMFLQIETNSKCNLRCDFCAHSLGYPQVPRMTEDTFGRILEGIRELAVPAVCMNQYNEPLLDKKIVERIRMVAESPSVADIHMNTNGMLLSEEKSRGLIESGLTRLLVALDGYSKTVVEELRVRADFDRIVKNIERFLEIREKMNKKFPLVRLSFVRTKKNEEEIENWLAKWSEVVDYCTIQEYISPVMGSEKDYLIPTSSLRKSFDESELSCRAPFERVIFRPNGDAIPCCSPMAVETMIMGNITNQSLEEIWHSEQFVAIRRSFLENTWRDSSICNACLIRSKS
jgi:radical SAM protein with 4Fe4S-binding SPASM domain